LFVIEKFVKRISLIPGWLRNYHGPDFRFDLQAGLTVGIMLIPQGMAYAMIAGLPPVYGLYASTLPAILYAWFGTSRQLSVGPGALTALLTAAGIGLLAQAGSEEYLSMVALLAVTVGLIQFSLGVFKLGFLVNFLSGPVINGFTSAAAILIALSQLKYFLGVDLPQSQHLHKLIPGLIQQLSHIHLVTLITGVIGLAVLVLFKKLNPLLPGALIIVIVAILITWGLRLDQKGVEIVGTIPKGLPTVKINIITFDQFRVLFPIAIAIALVSFMESTAVARAMQSRHKTYKLIPNRELVSIGLANMSSGLMQAIPVTGGMSRSVVNDLAGARTGLSTIISSILILLTLVFLTPLFYYLPKTILAGIILLAVSGLLKWKEAKRLWQIDRKDFWMLIATFIGTLFLGIGPGIGIGVLLSLAWIIYSTSYPHHAELGRVRGTHTFRNVRRFQDLEVNDGVLIVRFDAPLYFANINRFREILGDYRLQRKDPIHTIIIDMEGIHSIDSTALDSFEDIIDDAAKNNILLLLAEVKGPVRDKFYKSGLTTKIGGQNFYVTVANAVDSINKAGDSRSDSIALQTNVPRK
jgi:SulP family sulfate permease